MMIDGWLDIGRRMWRQVDEWGCQTLNKSFDGCDGWVVVCCVDRKIENASVPSARGVA
jgi:hypothetical protein